MKASLSLLQSKWVGCNSSAHILKVTIQWSSYPPFRLFCLQPACYELKLLDQADDTSSPQSSNTCVQNHHYAFQNAKTTGQQQPEDVYQHWSRDHLIISCVWGSCSKRQPQLNSCKLNYISLSQRTRLLKYACNASPAISTVVRLLYTPTLCQVSHRPLVCVMTSWYVCVMNVNAYNLLCFVLTVKEDRWIMYIYYARKSSSWVCHHQQKTQETIRLLMRAASHIRLEMRDLKDCCADALLSNSLLFFVSTWLGILVCGLQHSSTYRNSTFLTCKGTP